MNFFTKLFSGDGFMPHSHCYLLETKVMWLNIVSDVLITLAYLTIPFTLIYIARKRKDLPFDWMFACFGIFILACGATHALEVWGIWDPVYRLTGAVKAVTALSSIATAILLVRLIPQLLSIPNAAALRDSNRALEKEIVERKRTEYLLRMAGRIGRLGAWSVEIPSNSQTWSDEVCAIYGVAPGDVLGVEEAVKYYTPKSNQLVAQHFDACAKDGTPYDLELEMIRPDGRRLWLRAIGEAERDAAGAICRVQGALQDISDQKHAETALHKSEARYRSLFENMLEGYVYCELLYEDGQPRDYVYLEINSAFERLTGLKDAVGKKVTEMIPGMHQSNPEQLATYARVAETGQPEYFENYVQPLDIWFSVAVYSHEKGHFVAVFDNITARKKSAATLAESAQRLQLATEITGTGIWDWDLLTNDIVWDKQMFALYGHQPQPITYETWKNSVHPDDFAEQSAILAETARTGGNSERQFRIYRQSDGALRTIFASEMGLKNAKGEVVRVIGVNRDITVQQQNEENLRESKRFAESIADSSTGIIYIFDLVTRQNTYSNRNMAEFLGYTPDEVYQMGDKVVSTVVHPDDVARIVQHHADYAQVTDNRIIDLEFRMRYADGTWHWIWSRETVFQRKPDGTPWRIMGTAQDFTERRRIEEELKQAKIEAAQREGAERLSFLADAVPQIIWTAQPDGNLDYYNKAWFDYTGLTLDQTKDWGWGAVLHPEDLQPAVEAWTRAFTTGENYRIELRLKRASDGAYRWHLASALPMRDEHGRIVQWIGTTPDIHDARMSEETLQNANDELGLRVLERTSELHAAKESAEAANRAKSEFLANMSHEIRTPMNGILGMTELVLDTDLDRQQRDYLDMAQSSANALLGLINNILDFSKIEAGKLELEAIPFSLRKSIHHMLKPIALRSQQKGLELRVEIADEVPEALVGDPLRLRQILLNFTDNALKFTERGFVEVRVVEHNTKARESCLHFAITDTGIGIPAEKQGVIFEAFAQVDGSTTRNYGGTGLGLAIVSQLIEQMRGHVWIESVVNQGTTFHFTAWFGLGETTTVEQNGVLPAKITRLLEGPQASLRILLAEDNVVNRAVATALLEKRGHSLVHAANGFEAVDAVARERFDLVLMDVQMPEMDGFEATACIRAAENGTGQHLRIAAMTAHALAGDRERCLAGGMDDYISKPLEKDAVVALLARAKVSGKPAAASFARPTPPADAATGPERPQSAPSKTAAPPIYTREELLEELDGDEELLQRMVSLYRLNTPCVVDEIRNAVTRQHGPDLNRAAHALLSSLGAFGAKEAYGLTQQLEAMGLKNDFSRVEGIFAQLETATDDVSDAIEQLVCSA